MANKTLKIGIVLNTAWNIYNFRLPIIKALLIKGHRVVAIAPDDEYVPYIINTGCQYIPVKFLSRKGVNPIRDIKFIYELYNIYKEEKFDLVLQYTIKPNIYGCFAARLAKVKTISTITGLGYTFLSNGIVNQIAKILYKFAFKTGTKFVFQNRDDKKLFEDIGICPVHKTSLIKGSGIDASFFKPLPKSQESANLVFLFVGRLLYDKGISEMFEASRILKNKFKNTEVWVVGAIDEGNPAAVNKLEVEQNHEQGIINYLGTSKDVRSIIQNVDVVVLPSYREGLPRVMLESLSMAKAIITTDVAGCREVVLDKINGFMVPARDANALSRAMISMCELNPEQRKAMGLAGRQLVLDQFDEKIIIKEYFKLIDTVLNIN
ncbi:MAG: glycosyltransferase family 4 protein [Saprospiraceae bacterium]|nr:glycosyltransferase family 4 protein [Saprospiraceae bacterium]